MGRESERETAEETGSSVKEARAAEHQARDDARADGLLKNGDNETNGKSFDNSPGGWAEGFADALSGFFK